MQDRSWRTRNSDGKFAITQKSLKERFEEKYTPIPECGCWIWTGGINSKGYGRMAIKENVRKFAHRLSWEIYVGPIPEGLNVLHKCDTPLCVNPEHLFIGTFRDNTIDAIRKGRLRPVTEVAHLRRKYKWSSKAVNGQLV